MYKSAFSLLTMDGWRGNLRPFQQYFSHNGTWQSGTPTTVEKMESSLGPLDQTTLLAVNILKSGTPKNLVWF